MFNIAYLAGAFFILGLACIGIQFLSVKSRVHPAIGNNPIFLKFQYKYFAAYYPALFADWLQGPYLYRLYHHYSFSQSQIAIIYACGFASTVLLGTWAPIVADRFGRRKICVLFTIIYSVACFLKLSDSYGILIIGRILGGISTSLLFYTFEAWYVHEHIETNDFPKEWIPVTFSKATMWNGVLAIGAGVVANLVAEWFPFGPVAPFLLAVPCLLVSGIMIMGIWNENYGSQKVKFRRSMIEGLKCIMTDQRIFLIGVIHSLFESVMYIFVFLWTPVLAQPHALHYGIIFSCFMICIMIGSALFHVFASRRIPVVTLLAGAIFLSSVSMIMSTFSTRNENMSFFAFLLMELGVGIYFPAMGFIRQKIIPEQHTIAVLNWFRVPLNLIACGVLVSLHQDNYMLQHKSNQIIFVTCTILLSIAMACLLRFGSLVKRNQNVVVEQPSATTEEMAVQNLKLIENGVN